MISLKSSAKKIINSMGFNLNRYTPASNSMYQLHQVLKFFDIDLVLDVGANKGQFSLDLRSIGFKDTIVSFEPLTEAHSLLSEASFHDENWITHPRCAIGNIDGEIDVNISANSVSSSVLPMLEAHSNAAPGSVYISREKAPVFKLDTICSPYLDKSKNPFIKIDTQGFEWQVLEGASETLKKSKGIICELSLTSLYEGQKLWQDIISFLAEEGFSVWAVQKGFTDPKTGRTLQIDVIFTKNNA